MHDTAQEYAEARAGTNASAEKWLNMKDRSRKLGIGAACAASTLMEDDGRNTLLAHSTAVAADARQINPLDPGERMHAMNAVPSTAT